MLAARLEEGTLRIGDVPTPEPGDGEALVKISAAGVCHSDLHLARGDWLDDFQYFVTEHRNTYVGELASW